jgi:hypothetical protein
MTLKIALTAAAAMLASSWIVAPANAHGYRHGHYYECYDDGDWCYDDQWRETRELNLAQLDNPGAGACAVPGYYGPCFSEDPYDDDGHFEWWHDERDADDDDEDDGDD